MLRGNDFITTKVHVILLRGCKPRWSDQGRMLRRDFAIAIMNSKIP